MEKVSEAIKDETRQSLNFFSFVFNFDEDNKAGMLNMIQYTVLALLPVIIILKLVKHYIPEEDDSKPSIEIALEVIVQLIIIFLSIWFIDKMIRFIPTYSQVAYYQFNETNFIIPILIILVTMQTKLGGKINIIIDRILSSWFGKSQESTKQKQGQVKVSQPIASGRPQHQPSQADSLNQNFMQAPPPQSLGDQQTTMISDLPIANQQQTMQIQNEILDPSPIMAANEALGGNFGSLF